MKLKIPLHELRIKNNLTQEELVDLLEVPKIIVLRWESGYRIPNLTYLKKLSKLFDVSINTLMGSPKKLQCQCCGIPLEDSFMSKELNGEFNENYCKDCYSSGIFTYKNLDDLLSYLTEHPYNKTLTKKQAYKYYSDLLPGLDYWKSK